MLSELLIDKYAALSFFALSCTGAPRPELFYGIETLCSSYLPAASPRASCRSNFQHSRSVLFIFGFQTMNPLSRYFSVLGFFPSR